MKPYVVLLFFATIQFYSCELLKDDGLSIQRMPVELVVTADTVSLGETVAFKMLVATPTPCWTLKDVNIAQILAARRSNSEQGAYGTIA